MALKPLNSGYGFSVGVDSIINVIDVDGNVTANVLTVDTYANLGNVSNVSIGGGSNGYVLQTDGTGNLNWVNVNSAISSNQISNGDSNVSIPDFSGNIYINANAGVDQQWVFDASGTLTAPGNTPLNGLIPFNVPLNSSYKVYDNQQGLFGVPIEIDGQLEIDGVLIDVTTAGVVDASYEQILFNINGIPTGNTGFTFNPINGDVNLPGNVRITGDIVPYSNNISNLGSSTQRWGNLYLSGNSIYLGNSVITTDNSGILTLTSGTGASLSIAGNANVTTVQNGNTSIDVTANGSINFTVAGIANIATLTTQGFIVNSNVDFSNASVTQLGPVSNVKITGGSNGQILTTDGTGNLVWSSSPADVTEIQNGTSNVNLPTFNGNVYINTNSVNQWVFDTTGNITAPLNGTANLGNLVTANYVNVAYDVNASHNIKANGDLSANGNANINGNLNLSTTTAISLGGQIGSAGQVLTSNGTSATWSTNFYYGPTPPDFSLLNYGDIFFYIDNPNNFQRLYMWVTDGSSSYFYDFLPPSF